MIISPVGMPVSREVLRRLSLVVTDVVHLGRVGSLGEFSLEDLLVKIHVTLACLGVRVLDILAWLAQLPKMRHRVPCQVTTERLPFGDGESGWAVDDD